ncbi:hypothetical protein TYRP_014970 [Tyrophagus putrescentiae]|nr:hypothetical protein TYRP_014970 [Tyrophagus putrescentiae]
MPNRRLLSGSHSLSCAFDLDGKLSATTLDSDADSLVFVYSVPAPSEGPKGNLCHLIVQYHHRRDGAKSQG